MSVCIALFMNMQSKGFFGNLQEKSYLCGLKQSIFVFMGKKIKSYSEGELIEMFGLKRSAGNESNPNLAEWVNCSTTLSAHEQYVFDRISEGLVEKIVGWNEEMLKMNFIAFVLDLGNLRETKRYKSYYENTIEGTVDGYFLKVKADMMIAEGILEKPQMPYFYFQEYKKVKDPRGDVTGQLLEAFLIAQEKNKNDKPLYGCTVLGREWEFYIMIGKNYYISRSYVCTTESDLLQIIAILRKFKEILETRLLD